MALSDLYLSLCRHEQGTNGAAQELEHEEEPLAKILARLFARGSELVFAKTNQRRFSYTVMEVGQASFLDLEIFQCWLHLRRSIESGRERT